MLSSFHVEAAVADLGSVNQPMWGMNVIRAQITQEEEVEAQVTQWSFNLRQVE